MISNLVFGFYKQYFIYIKLRGIGYKSVFLKKTIYLKIGYSHRVVIATKYNIKLKYISRRLFLLVSRDICVLKNMLQYIQKVKNRGVYKKKGIYLKGTIFNIKDSGKKSRF